MSRPVLRPTRARCDPQHSQIKDPDPFNYCCDSTCSLQLSTYSNGFEKAEVAELHDREFKNPELESVESFGGTPSVNLLSDSD